MGNQNSSAETEYPSTEAGEQVAVDGKVASSSPSQSTSASSSPRQRRRIGGRRKKLELSQEQLYVACRRVENIIYEFRQRAGTELVCAQLHRTWDSHFDQILEAWDGLTLPARRCMVQNMREMVIKRARVLHRIVVVDKGARRHSHKEKERIVSKLMEKIVSELFDTDVLYTDQKLLKLLGSILETGGGSECPPLVVAEVYHSFDITEESMKRSQSTNHLQKSLSADGSKQRSLEDMRWLRRQESSACVVDLLSFLPRELEMESRKALTIKLVTEMRNAFLVHFAVLMFGELIDDYDSVVHKYEYGSESETECHTSETEWSDIEEDSEEANEEDSEEPNEDDIDEAEDEENDGDSLDSDSVGIVIGSVPPPMDEGLSRSQTTPASWPVGAPKDNTAAPLSSNGVEVVAQDISSPKLREDETKQSATKVPKRQQKQQQTQGVGGVVVGTGTGNAREAKLNLGKQSPGAAPVVVASR
jgi:hypothetical protein